MSAMSPLARRMFDLVEPIGAIPYSADEPNEAMFALGFTNYWDTYFAGRAAPLGLAAAEGVDALLRLGLAGVLEMPLGLPLDLPVDFVFCFF